ncbi:MAG: hypothetical protein MZU97_15650 [Bacillus subtilis]|nr:hypothetical protein [Bacillus subtilis]
MIEYNAVEYPDAYRTDRQRPRGLRKTNATANPVRERIASPWSQLTMTNNVGIDQNANNQTRLRSAL